MAQQLTMSYVRCSVLEVIIGFDIGEFIGKEDQIVYGASLEGLLHPMV